MDGLGRLAAEDTYATMAEHAPAMLWRGDAQGKCVYLNRAQRAFWGVTDDGIDSFTWASTLLPEDSDRVYGPFADGMAAQKPFECEARYKRADGEIRILRTRAEPRFDVEGKFTGMIGVNTDVTDERRAQTELAESEARMRLLMKEMSHRIKNNLSTVLSIASQTGRSAASYEAFNRSFQARLQALAKSHDLLMRDATDSALLRDILDAELTPYRADSARTFSLDGAPVSLTGRAAVGMALIVHELATNAAKYGAYSAGGDIDVRWEANGDEAVRLYWRERGGPPAVQPSKAGFGSRLIDSLVRGELNGVIASRFTPDGFEADLTFRTALPE